MDWDKLRIFHMVAKAGSFTHAGETLNLSQSAVSRHISSFEEDLGITLFHRHARGLILTEQGEILFNTTSEIFAKMVMIEGQLSDARDDRGGPLSLTMPEFMATSWLAPLLPEFTANHSDISLSLLLDDRIFNLGMREADAAIRLHQPEQSDLIQRQIGTIQFAICANSAYLKKRGTPKTIDDLKKHTMIAYPDQSLVPYKKPNWLIEKSGISITNNSNVILINSVSTIFGAIKSGAGIGVIPKFMAESCKDIVEILPDVPRESVGIYFVYPEERRHSRRIATFRDFIVERIARSGLNPSN